jgi:hypothetical protein
MQIATSWNQSGDGTRGVLLQDPARGMVDIKGVASHSDAKINSALTLLLNVSL